MHQASGPLRRGQDLWNSHTSLFLSVTGKVCRFAALCAEKDPFCSCYGGDAAWSYGVGGQTVFWNVRICPARLAEHAMSCFVSRDVVITNSNNKYLCKTCCSGPQTHRASHRE